MGIDAPGGAVAIDVTTDPGTVMTTVDPGMVV